MRILGFNAFHGDSAAALMVDGEFDAAAEEDHFRCIEHHLAHLYSVLNFKFSI